MYLIYKHTCKENGKSYIGQTKRNPKRRWKRGYGYRGMFFYKAIEKYGWDGFDHIILEENIPTQEEANEKEKYYISLYDTINNGYNISIGGGNFYKNDGVKIVKLDYNFNLISTYNSIIDAENDTHIKSQAIIMVCKHKRKSSGGYIWMYSDEYNEINQKWKDDYILDSKKKKVVMLDFNYNFINSFDTPKDASNFTGISINSVYNCCNHKTKTIKNFSYIFMYEKEFLSNEFVKINLDVYYNKCENRKVIQKDLNGNILRYFSSTKEAEDITGIGHSKISKICRGVKHYNSAGGFLWEFQKD